MENSRDILIIFGGFFALLVVGWIGAFLAQTKNRSVAEGFLLGFFLGPLGLVIEALLPAKISYLERSELPNWEPPPEA